jgi:predicted acylesterase/phospholipase RssA
MVDIKYIVISGGGPTGLLSYGAIQYLAKEGFWELKNIKGIYGCSIGSYLAVVLSLGYDWEWLNDYFIKRPWNKIISNNQISFIDAFIKKGLFGEEIVSEMLFPLLSAKELTSSITLKELYEYNNIDIHLYTTNINTTKFTKVDISHKTHPNLSVIKAISMSMAYPFVFKPILINNDCFIDGGLLNNYPVNDCLLQTNCLEEEILAFKNIWTINETINSNNNNTNINNNNITESSTIIDYLIILLKKMQNEINTEPLQREVKYTVRCLVEDLDTYHSWIKALSVEEMRIKLIKNGNYHAQLFLSYINQN